MRKRQATKGSMKMEARRSSFFKSTMAAREARKGPGSPSDELPPTRYVQQAQQRI